jgi:hypothetical protein
MRHDHMPINQADSRRAIKIAAFRHTKTVDAMPRCLKSSRQEESFLSSCRVIGVSSLNLALPHSLAGPFFG